MYAPNFLITNYCNQNCSFCFARAEMSKTTQNKEISVADFKLLLSKLKRTKVDTVKLLGGEPLIHSRIKDIIELSLQSFAYVQVFTNGLISDDLMRFLEADLPKIKFTFNVMTPGFQFQKPVRELVIKRILAFAAKTQVTLSTTLDPFTDLKLIFQTVPKAVWQQVFSVRVGFSNPTVGERNYYLFSDFPKMGTKLHQFVRKLKQFNSKLTLHLDCGFTRCMFTDEQYAYLQREKVLIGGWGCFGKLSSMDIATDKTAFHCFPLYNQQRVSLFRRNLPQVDSMLLKQRYQYWQRIQQQVCRQCPFYGHTPDKCPGPCLGFLMNQEAH